MNLAKETRRHRINIQKPVVAQDTETGETTVTWQTVHQDVPCAINPLSVKDFLQSQSLQSEVTVRIVFRWIDGVDSRWRLVGACGCHLGKIYNPAGFLEDPESGREYITAPCSEGANGGDL